MVGILFDSQIILHEFYQIKVNMSLISVQLDQSITLSIVGDQEEANQWKEQQASARLQDEEDTEPEVEQDTEVVITNIHQTLIITFRYCIGD